METVSGVAGLIKVVLMMQHDEIVRQTHFEQLNPHITLEGTRLSIPTKHVAWPGDVGQRRAGVSSFGFGGTNTHLIVESPSNNAQSEIGKPQNGQRPLHVLKLSAKSEASVTRQAEQIGAYLDEHPDAALADICWSLNTGRADFNHRAAIVAENAQQLKDRLNKIAHGEAASAAGMKRATLRALTRPKVAFLFTGQGLQYTGMGRGLYETQPVFRDAINACEVILREHLGGESLTAILFPPTEASSPGLVHQTEFTQPALLRWNMRSPNCGVRGALCPIWCSATAWANTRRRAWPA